MRPGFFKCPNSPEGHTLETTEPNSQLNLWHLLSLDAPTVATLWLLFFAHIFHAGLPVTLAPAMFLAVWIIYALDRLLDTHGLRARHHFHQRHAKAFGLTIAAATLALIPLVARFPAHLLHSYLELAAAFVIWFALIHFTRLPATPFKELALGLFFAVAICLPIPAIPDETRIPLAILATCNALLITAWESFSSGKHIRLFLILLTVGGVALHTSPTVAIALAAALLWFLDRYHARLHPTTARALADAALLTPILLWPIS